MTPRSRFEVRKKDQPKLDTFMIATGLDASEIFSLFLNLYGAYFLESVHRTPPQAGLGIGLAAPPPIIEIPEENLPAIEL